MKVSQARIQGTTSDEFAADAADNDADPGVKPMHGANEVCLLVGYLLLSVHHHGFPHCKHVSVFS